MDKELKDLIAALTGDVKAGNKTIEEAKAAVDLKIAELKAKTDGTAEQVVAQAKTINELTAKLAGFDELKEQVKQIETHSLAVEMALKRVGKTGPTDGTKAKDEKRAEYDKKFRESLIDERITKNDLRELELKLLSTNSDPDGGYLVSSEIEAEVSRVANNSVTIRGLCFVKTLGKARSWKKRVNKGGATARWESEGAQDTTNTATQQYAQVDIAPGKIIAKPLINQESSEDAEGVEQELTSELGITFSQTEAVAFISGNGVERPMGMLSYPTVADASWAWGSLGYITTGSSGAFLAPVAATGVSPADCIIDLIAALPNKYLPGASFVANKSTIAVIRKFKNAFADFVWQDSLQKGTPALLFGYPIYEVSDMPAMGANSFSLAFGDFRQGYAIVDRAGMTMLRDPYSKKPDVEYCVTKRVGGGIIMFDAIKLLKFI